MADLKVGVELTKDYPLRSEHAAGNIASGGTEVLSTHAITAFMENAAMKCVQHLLPEGYTTVGVRIDIRHFARAPIEGKLRVTAQLTKIDERRLTFKVKAEWQNETVSEGEHERFVVTKEYARVITLTKYIHSHEALDIDF
jgi:predicted thioesterase